MTTRHKPFALPGLAVLLLVTGCVTAPTHRFITSDDAGLYAWVERELAPYLAGELAQHPRFKAEPVLIVAMTGADVRPEIDALTREVRERLMDQLLHTPGVDLVWRPTQAPWQHHRTRSRLRCNASAAHYYVGIEITATTGAEYRVSVRALDMREQTWVSGFGRTWYGTLTASQRSALSQRTADEYLRGLRVLPFTTAEPDLLAAYLAQNVGCLLNAQGAQASTVYVEPAGGQSSQQAQVVRLVRNYLDRHQQLTVTDEPDAAELLLTGAVNVVHRGLHQVWLSVKPRNVDERFRAVATDAYVQWTPNTETARRAANAAPNRPAPPGAGTLLTRLKLLTPRSPLRCATSNPWAEGSRLAKDNDAIEAGECYAVTFDLTRDAHVFLLKHGADGKLTRVLPRECGSEPDPGIPIAGGTSLQFPATDRRRDRVLHWAGGPALESFYAIAVMDSAAAWRVARHLERLPDACGRPARPPLSEAELDAWLAQLDALMAQLGHRADWQALRVRHQEGPHAAISQRRAAMQPSHDTR